jgi:hypothetical protein
MDRETNRYRRARIQPGTGGKCRDCGHHVDSRHSRTSDPKNPLWCADCEAAGTKCGGAVRLASRAKERALARAIR